MCTTVNACAPCHAPFAFSCEKELDSHDAHLYVQRPTGGLHAIFLCLLPLVRASPEKPILHWLCWRDFVAGSINHFQHWKISWLTFNFHTWLVSLLEYSFCSFLMSAKTGDAGPFRDVPFNPKRYPCSQPNEVIRGSDSVFPTLTGKAMQ